MTNTICEVLLRLHDFRSAGPFTRAILLTTGCAVLVVTSTRLAPRNEPVLHIDLAPLPGLQHVAKLQPHQRHPPHLLAGIASWYGEVFDGHMTASGEVFHKDLLTACHPTLPFGTLVRVVNLRNHRAVVVRINDRGPLEPGRIIDLSLAAADEIGMLRTGVVPVRLEVLRAHG